MYHGIESKKLLKKSPGSRIADSGNRLVYLRMFGDPSFGFA
jgi:hypothetical protein